MPDSNPINRIVHGDNMDELPKLPGNWARLVYIDPPFNTGKIQYRTRIKAVADESGGRIGFGDKRYSVQKLASSAYDDRHDDYLAYLEPRLREARRILTADGSLFFHIDYREAHYCKVLLDSIFGRDNFMNEIIWAYDFGARSKKKWSAKHDSIFWYAKDAKNYVFNFDEMDRIPYMAPGLVGKEKAKRGKTPTDVWWHTIVPTNGKEKTGYPTQKPLGILERIIKVHSEPGDVVVDFFAGSGTTGEAAAKHGRRYWLCDINADAVRVMEERLRKYHGLSDIQ